MKMPAFTTIDFETYPISRRPAYPPKPVSFSVKEPGKAARWFGWGHPSGNNCSLADAKRVLTSIWRPGRPLLFHNGKFDVDVAETHMGVPRLPALDMHDSMFLMYLREPHSKLLKLKPLAERWLNMLPEERDVIDDWAKAHRAENLDKFHTKPFQPGAYIGYAPGELVKPYANGDVDRTLGLAKIAWKYINDMGMLEAYQREQQIMPIFLDNERVGLRIDVLRLRRDIALYERAFAASESWLRKKLKSANVNFDSDAETAELLSQRRIIKDSDWTLTATGQRSTSKKNLLPSMFKDQQVARALGYRNRLATCLRMFMVPWLAQAEANGGYISYSWNQVRGPQGGTRTGRPSMTDFNLLNVSKAWGVDDGYEHPEHLSVDPLPLVRRYCLPDPGGTWLHRDFNGQELRILAHGEDGALMQAYIENPWLDVHRYVAGLIEEKTGLTFERKNVKIANFRIIYGGGAPATASGIGCSLLEAKELLDAHAVALPSIRGPGGFCEQLKSMGKRGEPIYTWGGRVYYAEPPSFSKKYGRHMTYEYKLPNVYCQGSAADATKEAIIRYEAHPRKKARFLVQVYDELNSSAPKGTEREQMNVMRESMEGLEFDVPMLTEGKTGPTWGDQKPFDDRRN